MKVYIIQSKLNMLILGCCATYEKALKMTGGSETLAILEVQVAE